MIGTIISLLSYLVQKGLLTKEEADRSTVTVGEKGELKASMSTYITMKKVLDAEADADPDMCEDIVLWHTLNQDKNIVEKLILDKYGDKPIIKQNIKKLKGLTGISEFSPLSKEFLCGISGGADESTGEIYTVLNRLYETNMNLNEILFEPRYCFQDAIDRENGTEKTEVTYEDLEDLYVSPAVRRGIWQALKMADEYVSVMGKAPKKIFVEVTRKKEEKKQTISRKKRLEGLYKDAREIGELQAALNKRTEAELRQERLYLYFLQLGKCAYTGKPIDLGKLNSNLYDVDHILPRSFLKDDSIDNKVLCLREKNATKSDQYPLPDGFSDQRDFWETLRAKELMSEKK
ncbi:MAG: type II CRISPR RNA-guided endonuclease Cas9, partial [Candidatus Borkfalkiaceae bacterium]|nr:type II CRISPR RNA-guided endonuclease Cas9 [Christensenellaceae bacterium]